MAKIGRNEPCPCGSGRKYKKCCLGTPHDPARRHRPAFPRGRRPLPQTLAARAANVEALFEERGIVKPYGDDEEEFQRAFEVACQARWRAMAAKDGALEAAFREALALGDQGGADDPPACLRRLAAGGEAGVPYLGQLLHEPAWVSNLTIGVLTGMPPGALRDRAVAEALFVSGDWVPDAATKHVRGWPAERAWAAFEGVARRAAEDGAELQSLFWMALFEDEGANIDIPLRPRRALGDAMRLLFDLGHFGALAWFLSWLSSDMDSPESVEAFLGDEGVQGALEHLRNAPEARRLADRAGGLPRKPWPCRHAPEA